MTTGRLDTRFSGPTFDPLSKEADYDPQSAAISSAYVSAFNDYVRKDLKFGDEPRCTSRKLTSGERGIFCTRLRAPFAPLPHGDERDARSGQWR